MTLFRALIVGVIIAGCGTSVETPGPEVGTPTAKYEHVGTYESFPTPIGSSISLLMVDGRKLKITSVDSTEYINMTVNGSVPEMWLNGTYGVSGELRKKANPSGAMFIVRTIEYLGGGERIANYQERQTLPDFFAVDGDARGPLTLSELQIQFPDSLDRYFNSGDRECFEQQVEMRAAEIGDPETMPEIRRVLLVVSQEQWEQMTNADKRLQLARYLTSMGLHAC